MDNELFWGQRRQKKRHFHNMQFKEIQTSFIPLNISWTAFDLWKIKGMLNSRQLFNKQISICYFY